MLAQRSRKRESLVWILVLPFLAYNKKGDINFIK
jgi:hypothetical protein